MAMQSGAVMVPDKVPVQWYAHQQQPSHNPMDELLQWFRSEFAAANAMIDCLCHHLRAVGDPGEYEGVIGAIQQRRCNWNPVLHMQQYFPVTDVVYSLQQVAWKRQQWGIGVEGSGRGGSFGKEFRRGGRGYRGSFEGQNTGRGWNWKDQSNGHLKGNGNISDKLDTTEKEKLEEKDEKTVDEKSESNGVADREGLAFESASRESCNAVDGGSLNENGSALVAIEKQNASVSPKTFASYEIHNGISVNIAEGMKVYEHLVDSSDVLKIATLVNELRVSGTKGQLQGQAFIHSRRPAKGHGRDMIQLGIPVVDAPAEDDALSGTPKDMKIEPIPESLQHIIEHLITQKIVNVKPDSCIIDIFDKGDHSQPHNWPHWFGKQICVLFLTECEMSFGKVLTHDQPGDYRGALRLSLHPGDVLVVEGTSAEFTRYAIPLIQKQRTLVTLIKSLPRKANLSNPNRFDIVSSPPSSWSPPPNRSPNHARRGASSSILPTPVARPQLPPPNAIQSVFIPPVAGGLGYPSPVAAAPPPSAPWLAPPRVIPPGTGVFLPPQGSPTHSNSSGATNILSAGTFPESEELNVSEPSGTQGPYTATCNGTDNGNAEAAEELKDLH